MADIGLTGSIGVPGAKAVLGNYNVVFATDANHTLTAAEWSNNFLQVTGTISATREVIAPLNQGQSFMVWNDTTGGQSITVIGATGTGVTIPNGELALVACDGTNYLQPSAGSSGSLSGMTAGQVPIAATATTVTSSKPLAGTGAAIVTGPNSAITTNQLAVFNGTSGQIINSIQLSTVATFSGALPAGHVLVGAAGNLVADSGVPLAGSGAAVTTGPASGTTAGHLATFVGTNGQIQDGGAVPTSLPPSGAAGGDLAGTYPNPTVAGVHATSGTLDGVTIGATTPIPTAHITNLGVGGPATGHPLFVTATGTNGPAVFQGGSGELEFWQDSTPTTAASFGLAVPAMSIDGNFHFSTYNSTSGSWLNRMQLQNNNGHLLIATATDDGVNVLQVNGGAKATSITIASGTAITGQSGTGGTVAMTASPGLTGTPTVPTAAPGTNTTQAASTAFVQAAVGPLGNTDETVTASAGAATLDSSKTNHLINVGEANLTSLTWAFPTAGQPFEQTLIIMGAGEAGITITLPDNTIYGNTGVLGAIYGDNNIAVFRYIASLTSGAGAGAWRLVAFDYNGAP